VVTICNAVVVTICTTMVLIIFTAVVVTICNAVMWLLYVTLWWLLYRVSHELRSLLRECVPYVKIYRYNPKHLCPMLNGFGENDKRKVWAS